MFSDIKYFTECSLNEIDRWIFGWRGTLMDREITDRVNVRL